MTLVHSDGSSIAFKTTSPKSSLVLTKDCYTHFLWNPKMASLDDTTGEVSRFTQKYGDLNDFFSKNL
jgi:ribosomal protein L31